MKQKRREFNLPVMLEGGRFGGDVTWVKLDGFLCEKNIATEEFWKIHFRSLDDGELLSYGQILLEDCEQASHCPKLNKTCHIFWINFF